MPTSGLKISLLQVTIAARHISNSNESISVASTDPWLIAAGGRKRSVLKISVLHEISQRYYQIGDYYTPCPRDHWLYQPRGNLMMPKGS